MIFADTSYFLALLSPRNQWHAAALRVSHELHEPMFTTAWVLVELANAMAKTGHRDRCGRFIRNLQRAGMEVVPATSEWFEGGLALYEARTDKEWSLTDCISFEVMKACGATIAASSDAHFEQAGYEAVLRR